MSAVRHFFQQLGFGHSDSSSVKTRSRTKWLSRLLPVFLLFGFLLLPAASGAWGPMNPHHPMPYQGPIPKIHITDVVRDESVTIKTYDFPADQEFTVTMGPYGTRGIHGIVVGTYESGTGDSYEMTFEIPEALQGSYKIAIRLQTEHMYPYYSFNWFYNNTTYAHDENGMVDQAAETVDETGTKSDGEVGTGGLPTMEVVSVEAGQSVTIETIYFPVDLELSVTMGAFGSRGVDGIVVDTFTPTTTEPSTLTFDIPEELQGEELIAIRFEASNGDHFFVYDFFQNQPQAESEAAPVEEAEAPVAESAEAAPAEEGEAPAAEAEAPATESTEAAPAEEAEAPATESTEAAPAEDGEAPAAESAETVPAEAAEAPHEEGDKAENGDGAHMPTPPMGWPMGHMGWQMPIPTIKIIEVVADDYVIFETYNFPADTEFFVSMGPFGSRGFHGVVVDEFNSGEGGSFSVTVPIAEEFYGAYRIAIATHTGMHGGPYSYNWFFNNTTYYNHENGNTMD